MPEPGGEARLRFREPGALFIEALGLDDPSEPTDLELGISYPHAEHVLIYVSKADVDADIDEPIPTPAYLAAKQQLHRLAGELAIDVKHVRQAHGCPRRASSTSDCHITNHTALGEPRVVFAIPTNRCDTWLDLIAYELVRLNPHATESTP